MTTSPISTLSSSAVPLATAHDAVLLDLDGVVWLGADLVPNAREALAAVEAAGVPAVYVTNNASRPASAISDQLSALGIPTDPARVMTASLAATTMLRREVPAGATVLCVGGPGLHQAMADAGFTVVTSAQDNPVAVVQGYGADIGWVQLSEAAYAVAAGARYFATNLDATLPTERGFAVGNGSLVAAVVNATGISPMSSGKPEAGIFHEAAALVGAKSPVMVGDRLDTDLAGARNAGIPGLLVLTGVCQVRDLLAAVPHERPSFVALDVRGLLDTHPAVVRDGERLTAGDGIVVVREADVHLLRDGAEVPLESVATITLEELLALCVGFWELADAGTPLDVEQVVPSDLRVVDGSEQP